MAGELGSGTLPARLAAIADARLSGRLAVEAEAGGFELFFAGGRLVGARDASGPGLEASLRGVDGASLAAASQRARVSGRRLSAELAESGALDAEAIRSGVEAHTGAVLGRGLRVRRGSWRFEAGLDRIPAEAEIHLEASAASVLLAAAASVDDEAALRFHLGDLDRILALAPEAETMGAALSPLQGFVMSRVNGLPTLSEVLMLAGSGVEAKQALLGLICAGIVRVTDRPPRRRLTPEQEAVRRELLALSDRLGTLSHFELLGVPVDVSPAALRKTWARLAVRYHPDRLGAPELADLAPKAGVVLARMSEAFQVLSDPAQRDAYTRGHARTTGPRATAAPEGAPGAGRTPSAQASGTAAAPSPAAASPVPPPPRAASPTVPPSAGTAPLPAAIEEQLCEAQRHFRERRFWDALQLAEPLLRRAQGRRLRERLHILCARCRAENPRWRHEAEAGLRAALEENPGSAEIHYELARLYRRVGLVQRATTELRAALASDPGHGAAREELTASRRTPPGLLRGLRDRLAHKLEHVAS